MKKFIVCLLLITIPSYSWWEAGHRAIAGLAYDQLNKKARAHVDDLIRRHPDYQLFIKDTPNDAKTRARTAFTRAALWADWIKNDKRFYNEAIRTVTPTPTLPGYPDMKQNRDWHYVDLPFTQDGTRTKQPPEPNALSELAWIIPTLGKSGAAPRSKEDPVYLLPWLIHIEGDLHQPLHTVGRFRKGQDDSSGKPTDDQGGNLVFLAGNTNLHSLWDGILGAVDTNDYTNGLIKTLAKIKKEKTPVTDPKLWVEEGVKVAEKEVYTFPSEEGLTRDHPYQVTDAYKQRAEKIARERAALGGQRLAALLNQIYGK